MRIEGAMELAVPACGHGLHPAAVGPMKRRSPFFLSAGLLSLAALCLTGCVSSRKLEVRAGSVSAHAVEEKGVTAYHQIEVHNPMDDAAPKFWIRLPTGKYIDRNWYTYDNLTQAGFQAPPGGDFQPGNVYSHELKRYGVSFYFDMGSLKLIRFYQISGPGVSLGREHGTKFYALPLTSDQFEELFGKPETIK